MATGRRFVNAAILGCFLASTTGCSLIAAGQAQPKMLDALADHDLAGADAAASDPLGTPIGKLPDKRHAFTGLLLAERGTIRLSSERYAESAADLGLADKLFDIRDMGLDDVMREILTPRTTRQAFHMGWLGALNFPAVPRLHERMMLNGLSMLDYLDLGDADNARVESRRLDVMQTFAGRLSPQSHSQKTRAFTGILAGFAFEQAGDTTSACEKYREAEAASEVDLTSLVPGGKDPRACKNAEKETSETSELLLVVAYGLVPHAQLPPGPPKTISLPGGGTTTLPQYAELVGGSDDAEAPSIEVDGKLRVGVPVLNLASVVQDDFAQAVKEIGGNTAPLSWSSLPARFVIDRVSVKPGSHHVRLSVRGETKSVDLVTSAGGFAVTSLVVLR